MGRLPPAPSEEIPSIEARIDRIKRASKNLARTVAMSVLFIMLIIGFAIAVGVALVRGLLAFHNDAEHIRRGADPARLGHGVQQNRMMQQRVLFQAIVILLVAILGALAAHH